jgi:hypothetical protein
MKLELKRQGGETWGSSVYYAPEAYGLTTVAAMDWDHEPYQFNLTVVFADAEGRLWFGSDSGCSCPTPFENVGELDRLFSVADLEAEASRRGKSLDRDFERAVAAALKSPAPSSPLGGDFADETGW